MLAIFNLAFALPPDSGFSKQYLLAKQYERQGNKTDAMNEYHSILFNQTVTSQEACSLGAIILEEKIKTKMEQTIIFEAKGLIGAPLEAYLGQQLHLVLAARCFSNALVINPFNITAIYYLAEIHKLINKHEERFKLTDLRQSRRLI